ncbi:ABC transporter ATP-binding protein [Nocardioides zeae]|uniref:ABC-type quaternary amine transporter n=1 Tax=Nocardioides zeae TaxID=1457234 RepID=A0AAJ1U0J7_9ACTN|nr:ABC transporter ATP-binding protein [Nocardioides zeae]MDQ1105350.1 thiamine transport system ATP-binding protein [Nocardioides zeae]
MVSTTDLGDGLRLRGVTVAYDGVPALADASLHLPAGEVLAVLGPSGSGKSTLLRAVAGLEPLAAGSVAFDGADLAGVPPHRRGFALMFQDGQLFGHLSVGRNVAYPLRLRRTPRATTQARVAELLALVGLEGYADRAPGTLSGGERQRVALARALACAPRLLLLDEPLSALDRALRERLAGDLAGILRAAGTTALLVTHDVDEAYAVADRVAVVRGGRVVQEGTVAEVDAAPRDAEVARLLGYPHVVGDRAVRRTAFAVAAGSAGAGTRPGTVLHARATSAGRRLLVDLDGVGPVDVVPSPEAPEPEPGERVEVRIDPAGTAPLGGGGR